MRWLATLTLAAAALSPAPSVTPASCTYPFQWTDHDLAGPGADHLRRAVSNAQFVMVGEQHNDRSTPLFTRALYAVLRRENGFSRLVVEQDPLGAELALAPGRRGDAAAIAAGLKTWPTLLGFASDQDLLLLADAGAAAAGPDAIWGLDQAQSPVRHLEELATLAPAGPVREEAERLLARARDEERTRADFGRFIAFDPQALPALQRLAAEWSPPPDGRARTLLDGLVASAQIYRDHVDAEATHDPALTYRSGVTREAWMKARFTRDYRSALGSGPPPRALLKFGDNHIRRGVGTTGAWTLGAYVADLATYNGQEAYGVLVVPVGTAIPDWAHLPAEIRPLLPAAEPGTPILVDLDALRPRARAVLQAAAGDVRPKVEAVLFGFDALVVLPRSAPATWRLTGYSPY